MSKIADRSLANSVDRIHDAENTIKKSLEMLEGLGRPLGVYALRRLSRPLLNYYAGALELVAATATLVTDAGAAMLVATTARVTEDIPTLEDTTRALRSLDHKP